MAVKPQRTQRTYAITRLYRDSPVHPIPALPTADRRQASSGNRGAYAGDSVLYFKKYGSYPQPYLNLFFWGENAQRGL